MRLDRTVAPRPVAMARAWARIQKEHTVNDAGCWIMPGLKPQANGYCAIHSLGRKVFAHRAAWVGAHPDAPEPESIDHLCRNEGCCNPDHLEGVSHATNVKRGGVARSQGAQVRGRDAKRAGIGSLYFEDRGAFGYWVAQLKYTEGGKVVNVKRRSRVRGEAEAMLADLTADRLARLALEGVL